MFGQVHQHERAELPDGFFRARLAQAAPGKPAADQERKGDEFAGNQRRDGRQETDEGAGVGTGNQPGEKRTLQCQVGRVCIQEHADATPAITARPWPV